MPSMCSSDRDPRAAASSKTCGYVFNRCQTESTSERHVPGWTAQNASTQLASRQSLLQRQNSTNESAKAASASVQQAFAEYTSVSRMCRRTVREKKTRMRRSQSWRAAKDGFVNWRRSTLKAGKSSSRSKQSGWRTRVRATKSTPGLAQAWLSLTMTLARVMPCAFHGVSAQAKHNGNCVRETIASSSEVVVRGSSGTHVRREGSEKKAGPV